MNAWFPPEVAPVFSFFSLLSLLAVVGPLVSQGKYRTQVLTAFSVALVIGLVLLALGLVAMKVQQPGYVVFALLLSGALLSVIFLVLIPVLRAGYRDAEHRRIVAANL